MEVANDFKYLDLDRLSGIKFKTVPHSNKPFVLGFVAAEIKYVDIWLLPPNSIGLMRRQKSLR